MKDIEYAFCVARIRANEKYLLDDTFFNKLIDCEDYDSAVSLLKSDGWIEKGDCIKDFIGAQNEKLWNLIYESVPDKEEAARLCVLNDYFNIKCAVKCTFTGENADDYFIRPTTVDFTALKKAVSEKNFSLLKDELMSNTLHDAYDIVCKAENGQKAEIIIDFATLTALRNYAAHSGNSVFSEVCNFIVDTANIKTAFRCARTDKNSDFVKAAISDCKYLDYEKLISCVSEGEEALVNYLSKTIYSDGVTLYTENSALFEKWCDESVVKIIAKSKYTAFGFDPVCAFYFARLNEIKNVRIILTAKQSGISPDKLRERVRVSYA